MDADTYDEIQAELTELRAEIERLRSELRWTKGEFECERNWLDRAMTSDYRYRDDPALPGHREAMDTASKRIRAVLEQSAEEKT